MFEVLVVAYRRLLEMAMITTHRYLYFSFNINARLTGLIGPRGVGKTTLMLQYIKEKLHNNTKVFYFTADHIIFSQHSLLECIEHFYANEDIRLFFIDEIHKYKNWEQELKNIYDSFPAIKVVFSGSSSIDLIHGSYDLSRRARLYYLHGLSFREYLNFKTQQETAVISFDQLTSADREYEKSISHIPMLQKYFKEYLQVGYYPFYFEDPETYYERVARVIEKTIYEDIASFYNLKTENLHIFKKILVYLAAIPPGNVSTHNIAKNLSIDDKTIVHYLMILSKVGFVRLIYPTEKGNQRLRKPEKVFLDNTTLFHVLHDATNSEPEIGTVRELYFAQSVENAGMTLYYNKVGDFLINKIIFEIGGKNKTRRQIKKASQQAFLVKDDVLYAEKGAIPLFYFGFLY